MDRRTGGQTGGWMMDGWMMDGWTDGRVDKWTDGWIMHIWQP